MNDILKQLKARRLALGLKQHDIPMRAGMSRQQYQRLESKGNPRLETLALLAESLNCELMLIPKEKVAAVEAVLSEDKRAAMEALVLNPWQGLLDEDDDEN